MKEIRNCWCNFHQCFCLFFIFACATITLSACNSAPGSQAFGSIDPTEPQNLGVRIYQPAGPGPFPAIILLHGSVPPTDREQFWAYHFQKAGYVAVIIDSFGPRGLSNISYDYGQITQLHRIKDLYGAREYLKTKSFVDGTRIGIMGFSHGGGTVLDAINQNGEYVKRKFLNHDNSGFAFAIAFYPGCPFANGPYTVPLLIVTGELDDWTPARDCQLMIDKYREQSAEMRLEIIPDAHHAFDGPWELQYLDHVKATIGANPAAKSRAVNIVDDFVK